MVRKIFLLALTLFVNTLLAQAGFPPFVSKIKIKGGFCIASKQKIATIVYSDGEWPGVIKAAKDLQQDIKLVSGQAPDLVSGRTAPMAIIIGTIGQSQIIDQLIKNKKINTSGISDSWEATLIEVVKNPLPGVDSALIIAGSDKRGTIYGIYELSYQIGVSPWHYWADVPAQKNKTLYVRSGRLINSSPAVKYRGIFLNDEAPALSGWARKEFGGFNHKFYEKVFELILRLKGNYLWPAMWGSAFNDDDQMNPVLADEYGVVMGTSHHEPLARAHDEWRRFKGGIWNYEQNPDQLRAFWKSGLSRVAGREQIITVGMRGDGDEPMTKGTATALLEQIVTDQREIISNVTNKPAAKTPQLWALYKEVQDYYDQGMRVPDDVTLLLCDDNWGNIRRLPALDKLPRKGGYGIYYHFDYVGGPRNYKWINTNPIQKIWEQMNLAYQYKANQIWIVNVGDLKPVEFPIEFFLDFAWAPNAIPAEKLKDYTIAWCGKQFGSSNATEIADILDYYTKYNGRVKPELLNENTYSLINYQEFDIVVKEYKALETKAQVIYKRMPQELRDAYYQLIMHPVEASANLYELYYTVSKNKLYAKQGRVLTNEYADKADSLFKRDAEISKYYNKVLAAGKWEHMMDQTHIGYTGWQQPQRNVMPKTYRNLPAKPGLGLAIEGSDSCWTKDGPQVNTLLLLERRTGQSFYLELFNTGKGRLSYEILAPNYILITNPKDFLETEKRINIKVDWAKAPQGIKTAQVVVKGSDGTQITLQLRTNNNKEANAELKNFFLPQAGYISLEAPSYSRALSGGPISWKTIPNYGKTAGGVMPVPVTAASQIPGKNSAYLAYDLYLDSAGTYLLNTYISPTIDFQNTGGLKFALSVDDQPATIVNTSSAYKNEGAWGRSVINAIKIFKTPLSFDKPGKHTIKYWMVDPGVVLQKLVLDLGGLKPSFLGPQQTRNIRTK
ncbi:MAG: glycosyl hydrolase 115 family protein [Pedobacter sp.]